MSGKAAKSVAKAIGEYQYPWKLSKGVWGYWELGAWKSLDLSARHPARLRKEVLIVWGYWVFEPFGPVELVQLPLDQEFGQCKGFGFVQGLNARSRAILMQKLDRSGTATSITGSLGSPAVNGTGLSLPATSVLGVASVVNPLVASLGQTSMPALAGIPGANLPVPPIVPPVDLIGVPSECLLLKNMFDPNMETEPDFDLDIKDDVQDECLKFGVLKHIYLDRNSAGHVYLWLDNTQSARNAQQALHGRWWWFAGKMITATYLLPLNYEAKFPDGGR